MRNIGSYRAASSLPVLVLALATLLASCGGGSDSGRASAQSAGTSAGCPQVGMQCSGDSGSVAAAADFAPTEESNSSGTSLSAGGDWRAAWGSEAADA